MNLSYAEFETQTAVVLQKAALAQFMKQLIKIGNGLRIAQFSCGSTIVESPIPLPY